MRLAGGLSLLALLLGLPRLAAQQASVGAEAGPGAKPAGGLALTLHGDRYWVDDITDEHLHGLTLRGTDYKRRGMVSGFGVGVLGAEFADDVALLTVELQTGYMVGGRRGAVFFYGGALGLLTTNFEGGLVGAMAGVGGLVRVAGPLGVRADATRRVYLFLGSPKAWTVSVGVGIFPDFK